MSKTRLKIIKSFQSKVLLFGKIFSSFIKSCHLQWSLVEVTNDVKDDFKFINGSQLQLLIFLCCCYMQMKIFSFKFQFSTINLCSSKYYLPILNPVSTFRVLKFPQAPVTSNASASCFTKF